MHWINWIVVAWFALNALEGIRIIGKEAIQITPNIVMIMTIIYGLLIAGVIIFNS